MKKKNESEEAKNQKNTEAVESGNEPTAQGQEEVNQLDASDLVADADSTLTRGPITHKMVGDLPEAADPAEASVNQLDASGLCAFHLDPRPYYP